MKIKRKRWKNVAAAMLLLCVVLTGCGMSGEGNIKLRDLDFTVLSEEKIPEELKTVIAPSSFLFRRPQPGCSS